jgi:non-heme chloroperoxidase
VTADTKNPDRGPLLIMDGELDNTVPWAIANASYKQQKRNEGVTEIQKIPGRGHALTIDSGWREVAESALAFIRRFVSAGGTVAVPIESGGAQDDPTRLREKADQPA